MGFKRLAAIGAAAALLLGGVGVSTTASAAPTKTAAVKAAAAPVAALTYHQRRCDRDQVVLGLRNNLGATTTYQLRLTTSSTGITQYRTLSVGAGATAYFYTFGVRGYYYGYFYRYVSGTGYVYAGVSASGTNTCAVRATLQRSGNYGRVILRNTGTAYAGVYTRHLAPSVANYYNYVAPGTTVYTTWRYLGVNGTRYAIAEDILGGTVFVSPPYFAGAS